MSAEQRVIAYLDGELSPTERSAFEAELAADPALAAQVELHAALSARVARTYAPVLDEPVPPRLMAIAAATTSARRDGRRWRPAWWWVSWPGGPSGRKAGPW